MMHLFMERFATPIVPTLCYIESGNVALTQPIMITYIEDEMELEKEAKAFMDRRSREPKTMFELLTEMNHRLRECEKSLKEIREIIRKINFDKQAKKLIETKNDWHLMPFKEQSDYKCDKVGLLSLIHI